MRTLIVLTIFAVMTLLHTSCRHPSHNWLEMDNSQRVDAHIATARKLSRISISEFDVDDMKLVNAVKLLEHKLKSNNEGISIRVEKELPNKFPIKGQVKAFYENHLSVKVTNSSFQDVLNEMLLKIPGAVYDIRSDEIVISYYSYDSLEICINRELLGLSVEDLDKVDEMLNLELLVNLMNSTLNRCGSFSINVEPFFTEKVDLKEVELPVRMIKSLRVIDLCDTLKDYYGGQWILDGDHICFVPGTGH